MKRLFLSSAVALSAIGAASADPSDVAGMWLTESKGAIVEIADCGDGTPCGTVRWIDMENALSDKDINNPDEALRGQPIVGSQMLFGFERRGDRWRRGKIYNAENGRTYGSGIHVRDDGNLNLKGCVGPICQTQTWTPVPTDDPRLAAPEA